MTVPRPARVALFALAALNGISALGGTIGLTLFGGMGLPAQWLEATPFDSYVWPGLILGIVVGGTQLLALLTQARGYAVSWGLHAAAGLVLMVWIFVEVALMLVWAPLQGVYFVTGLAQTVTAVLALGAWPHPFLARTRP